MRSFWTWPVQALRSWRHRRLSDDIPTAELIAHASAVLTGAVLVLVTCVNQPYNQNELQQIEPYHTRDIDLIIHATRQPPLDPLIGALVQHMLGMGQLRQRLVPAIAGIIVMIILALLLLRLRTGLAGIIAIWATATAPLLVRYSAYSRPYALPLMLMVVYVYAAERYTEGSRRRWLTLLVVCAVAMPATRVPEPMVFLGVTVLVTAWRAWRGQLSRAVATRLLLVPSAALVLVGYPMFHLLAGETTGVFDPSPSGVIDRFPAGVREIVDNFLPTLAEQLPWWPVCVLALIAAVALKRSRALLLQWWFFWPLLAAPVVFALAYHFLNPFSFGVRPYRLRLAIFFVPALALIIAAVSTAVIELARQRRITAWAVALPLFAGVVLTQLPGTAKVLTQNEAPDYDQVAAVVTEHLPSNAIVLYDAISAPGQWRQPFSARPRYMGDKPYVTEVSKIPLHRRELPRKGPVYVLLLDSECGRSVVCDDPPSPWDERVDGWSVLRRFDRFTLYEPNRPTTGVPGAITALRDFAADIGANYGYPETFAAAALLRRVGSEDEGRQLIQEMYGQVNGHVRKQIQRRAERHHLDPFK